MRFKLRCVRAWLWILTETTPSKRRSYDEISKGFRPQVHRYPYPWHAAHRGQVFTFWYNKSFMSLQSCSTNRLRSSGPAIDYNRVLDLGPITKRSKWVRLDARIAGQVLLINLRCLELSLSAALGFSGFFFCFCFCFFCSPFNDECVFLQVELSWHL